MSSDINKNIKIIKKENEENEKTNEINNFSMNFNNCYRNLKITNENNKKNNKINKLTKDKNKNINKNNITNTSQQNSVAININSLNEFDLIDKGIPQIKKPINTKPKIKSKRISPSKPNSSYIILSSSSHDNFISTTKVQTTTVQSAKINNLKNQYLNSTKKKNKLIKSKSMKNLKKCSFSQQKFDSFLERVKQLQKKIKMNLKNLKNKFLESETSEMNAHIKMNKNSKKLLKTYYRSPLYKHKPLNEEKSIGKNFENFYADILKENQTNTYFSKNNKCKNKEKQAS